MQSWMRKLTSIVGTVALGAFSAITLALPQAAPSTQSQTTPSKPQASPEALALLEAGSKLEKEYKWDEALQIYAQALATARELKDRFGEGRAINRLGNVRYAKGEFRAAIESFQQAQEIYRELAYREGEAGMFNNIGAVYNRLGDQPQSLENYQKGLPLARALKDKRGETDLLINIGNVYNALGEYEKARLSYEQALPLARELQYKSGQAIILNGLGDGYDARGEGAQALNMFRQALALAEETGTKSIQADCCGSLGGLQFKQSRFQEALQYYQQALRLYEETGNRRGIASETANIANVYSRLRRNDLAETWYQRALTLHRQTENRFGEATLLDNLGAHSILNEDYGKASGYLESALKLHRQVGNTRGAGTTLCNLGLVYKNQKKYGKALQTFQEVLKLHKASPNPNFAATAENGIGATEFDRERYKEAIPAFKRAIGFYQRMGNREYESNTWLNMGRCKDHLKDTQGAEADYREALRLLESVRSSFGSLTESKVSFFSSHLNGYYYLTDLLLRQERVADAFAIVQKTKARALLDLMAGGQINLRENLTAQEKEKENRYRAECDRLNTAMIAEGVKNEVGSKKRFAALKEELGKAEATLAAYTDSLYVRHPDLAQKRVARTLTAAQAAKLLPKDTALLEYAVLKWGEGKGSVNRPVLFALTPDGKITAHTLKTTKAGLTKRAQALRAACANPRTAYLKPAQELYRLLIAPAEKRLRGKKHLILCPDGPLWDAPFAVLTGGEAKAGKREKGKGKSTQPVFLWEQYALSYAGSATGVEAALTARKRTPASGSVLALANPDFGDTKRFGDDPHIPGQRPLETPSRPLENPSRPLENPSRPLENPSRPLENPSRPLEAPSRPLNLPSRDMVSQMRGGLAELKGTQQEADVLRRLYPNAAIYTRREAQEKVVKEKAGNYRYLHLASHAFFNDASPMQSSVFLAAPPEGDSTEDGFLTAREIFDLKLNAEMVVLSACQTGRGEQRTGEGVIGLTWALFVAGCPTQALSQWSVDDAATAQLMSRFYTELKRGKSKADALRTAGTALLRAPKTRHPYFWAPFILVGDWQ